MTNDCAWCNGGTLGHPCEARDYWLGVEDSELDSDDLAPVERVRGRRITEPEMDW